MKLSLIFLTILLSNFILFSSQDEIRSDFFIKITKYNNFEFDRSFLLNSFESISTLKCLKICSKVTECFYMIYQQSRCFIGKSNLTLFMNYRADGVSRVYQKQFLQTNGLVNYWAFNGNVKDSIGNADLYGGVNAALTLDRFGQSNSALSLSNGHYRIPPGVYFSGTQLTIMAWVKIRSFTTNPRLIDLGNGQNIENVILTISHFSKSTPYFWFQSDSGAFSRISTKPLILNQWQHLSCVCSFPSCSIYIDGIEVSTTASIGPNSSFSLNNIVRTLNYVGRSNWYNNGAGDRDADADFDDLKFFNRALKQTEIQFEMNNNL